MDVQASGDSRVKDDWSTVPAAGSRVLVTGAAGGLSRAPSTALAGVGTEVVGIGLPGRTRT
jgi:hypothetical protein